MSKQLTAGGRLTTSGKSASGIKRYFFSLIIIFLSIFMLTPYVWMVSASLKREMDVFSNDVGFFPSYLYLDNYKTVLGLKGGTNYRFALSYWNSIKVAICATTMAVVSSCMAGYAFAKLKFRGSNFLFLLYLSQLMVPSQLTIIPRFVIFSEIGLTNNHLSLILPKIVSVSSTFMMRQAFMGVPNELREAAKIDGAGEFRIFLQVMVPMVRPTLAAVATVQFLNSWNSYMDPLIFINKSELYTIPLALNNFVSMEGTRYGLTMAACCFATIPVFIVFLCGQKFFMKGLTVGAVKG